ncbi:nuclear transport factor 2 family protein [Desnuesiella massiliensis]|uniref:nuclear transport factor 2 family protein n=1 Tax=Desnuesiella massiliensis TaxID=1650662 RepID=UPI0006E37950|nr:nuclear transport factor 2 family protein [Desnuesiella massiliensis]
MKSIDLIMHFWETVDKQEWEKLKYFFEDSATVAWPNTKELFDDINNYIRANSEYPGDWLIKVERIEEVDNKVITVATVSLKDQDTSFYAVSFFEITNGKIKSLTEYWGDNGDAPEWRRKLNLSRTLK